MAYLMGTGFLGRWIAANAVGELLGLGAGALLAFVALSRLEEVLGVVAAAIVSAVAFGLVEGSVVGAAQHRAMRPLPRRPAQRSWVVATAAGGTIAWLAVSLPFALLAGGEASPVGVVDEPPVVVQLAVMAAAGLPAGAVLGVPQALVLRRHAGHPWRWVAVNAVAWAAGLPIVQLVAGGFPSTTPAVVVAVVVAVGLLGAGAVVGAIHGPTLRRLLTDDAPGGTRPTPLQNRLAMWWVRHAPTRLRPRRLTVVEYRATSGRLVALPVVAVPYGDDGPWVVLVGRHEQKRWWRRFRRPTPATLTLDGATRTVSGALGSGTVRDEAIATYLRDQPRATSQTTDRTPVVIFTSAEAGSR